MNYLSKIRQLIAISHSHSIARRYLVVNGFDGALTTLGLLTGFYFNNVVDLNVSITACLGAAIALGMSGFSSAYVSEAAERKQEYRLLQDAMVTDLSGSSHDRASRWVPFFIAGVNGLSPLVLSLLIILPLWLAQSAYVLPLDPLLVSIAISFVVIFFLGVFLSKVSGTFWLYAGLQTILIAVLTSFIIFLIA